MNETLQQLAGEGFRETSYSSLVPSSQMKNSPRETIANAMAHGSSSQHSVDQIVSQMTCIQKGIDEIVAELRQSERKPQNSLQDWLKQELDFLKSSLTFEVNTCKLECLSSNQNLQNSMENVENKLSMISSNGSTSRPIDNGVGIASRSVVPRVDSNPLQGGPSRNYAPTSKDVSSKDVGQYGGTSAGIDADVLRGLSSADVGEVKYSSFMLEQRMGNAMQRANWEMAELSKGDTSHSWYQLAFQRKMNEKSLVHQFLDSVGLGPYLPRECPENFLVRLARSWQFSGLFAFLILVNTVFNAYMSHEAVKLMLKEPPQDEPKWWDVVDFCFTALFCVELLICMLGKRVWFFVAPSTWAWNVFDLFLVGTSVFTLAFPTDVDVMVFRIMRVFRVIRMARLIRVVRAFTELRKLLFAVLSCIAPLFWAALFLGLTMFLFSLLIMKGVTSELGRRHDEKLVLQVRDQFDGIGGCFKTLLIAIVGDDWVPAHDTLSEFGAIYACIMPVYIIFVNIGVMNIVIGVFAEAASRVCDRDLIAHDEIGDLESSIQAMISLARDYGIADDTQIDSTAFKEFFYTEEVQAFFSSHQLDASHAHLIFELCDRNHDGRVDIRDFVLGMMRLKGDARMLDFKIMLHAIHALAEDVIAVRRDAKVLTEHVARTAQVSFI